MERMSFGVMQLNWVVLLLVLFVLTGCSYDKISQNLYVGTVPDRARMEELKALGVKSIIVVRTNSMPKRSRWAKELGMNYYHIPTGVFKIPKDAEIDQFAKIMRDPKNTPAYVCCVLGDDRSAVYLGMYRVVFQGWTAERAYQEIKDRGLPEPWPVFHKYIDTLRMAERYRDRNHMSASVIQTQ